MQEIPTTSLRKMSPFRRSLVFSPEVFRLVLWAEGASCCPEAEISGYRLIVLAIQLVISSAESVRSAPWIEG